MLRLALLLVLLYGFLVAIGLLSAGFKDLGEAHAGGLFGGVNSAFAALTVGILATVLVQSSSVTTSTIVALVGSGELSLAIAVPMIMGANIGTTVTNTLVSIGSVRRSAEFQRAFAAATVHDVFNLLAVAVLLPIEISTGFLRRSAEWLTGLFHGAEAGGAAAAAGFKSPIKVAVKHGVQLIEGALESAGLDGKALAIALLVVAIAMVFLCLRYITLNMRSLLVSRIEASLNTALGRSGLIGMVIGIGVTVAVQSSSITTSILVPLCGAGLLTLPNVYPITLGANIGTTVTALIASLAADMPAALTIALVHLLFNLSGTLLFYPVPFLRNLPIAGARRLSHLAVRNKLWLLAYVAVMFVALPLSGILIFN